MPFFGQVFTKDGMKPDPHKVNVTKQWPTPMNVTELQSFLGSVNYLCKFIPYPSDLRQPLQGLLKSHSEFVWTQVHDEAFENLKQAICKDITLQFFDSDLPLYIEADASQKGIGVIMLQPDKTVKTPATRDTQQHEAGRLSPLVRAITPTLKGSFWVYCSVFYILNTSLMGAKFISSQITNL